MTDITQKEDQSSSSSSSNVASEQQLQQQQSTDQSDNVQNDNTNGEVIKDDNELILIQDNAFTIKIQVPGKNIKAYFYSYIYFQ